MSGRDIVYFYASGVCVVSTISWLSDKPVPLLVVVVSAGVSLLALGGLVCSGVRRA